MKNTIIYLGLSIIIVVVIIYFSKKKGVPKFSYTYDTKAKVISYKVADASGTKRADDNATTTIPLRDGYTASISSEGGKFILLLQDSAKNVIQLVTIIQ